MPARFLAGPSPGVTLSAKSQILAQHEERVIRIRPYTEEWSKAVGDFNRRGRPANAPFQLPETPAGATQSASHPSPNLFEETSHEAFSFSDCYIPTSFRSRVARGEGGAAARQ